MQEYATLEEKPLADGSTLYNVLVVQGDDSVSIPCYDEGSAQELLFSLSDHALIIVK